MFEFPTENEGSHPGVRMGSVWERRSQNRLPGCTVDIEGIGLIEGVQCTGGGVWEDERLEDD